MAPSDATMLAGGETSAPVSALCATAGAWRMMMVSVPTPRSAAALSVGFTLCAQRPLTRHLLPPWHTEHHRTATTCVRVWGSGFKVQGLGLSV